MENQNPQNIQPQEDSYQTFDEAKIPAPKNLDRNVVALQRSIRDHESQGKYDLGGQSGEYGAYQYTKPTWDSYSKKYLGGTYLPTPKIQDYVTYRALEDMKAQGLTPIQIASVWNSGKTDPNAAGSGTNQYGANYDTPAYAKSVYDGYVQHYNNYQDPSQQGQEPQQNIFDQKQQSPSYIQDERQQRIDAGEPVSVNPNKVEPSFAGSLLRGLASVPVKAGLAIARGTGLANLITGQDAYTKGFGAKSNYLGQVNDPLSNVDKASDTLSEKYKAGDISGAGLAVRSLGQPLVETLDLASLIPAEGAVSATGKALLNGGTEQVAKQAPGILSRIGTSAARGGLFGAGLTTGGQLASGEKVKPGQILGNAALGAGLDVGLSEGLPAAISKAKSVVGETPYLASAAKAAAGGVPDEGAIKKAQGNIYQELRKGVEPSIPLGQRQAQEGILKATGSNGLTTLAELGIVPGQDANGYFDLSKALPHAEEHLKNANDVLNRVKEQETGIFNVDSALNKAYEGLDKQSIDIKKKTALAQQLKDLVENNADIIKTDPKTGDRFIDAKGLVKLKQIGYSEAGFSKGLNTNKQAQNALATPFYDLTKNLDDELEKSATLPHFKKANKMVSDLISGKHILETLEGKRVPAGGLVNKIMRHGILSGASGVLTGNPFGAILGNMAADQLDKFYTNPELRTALARKIITSSGKSATGDLMKSVEEAIGKRGTSPIPATPKAEENTILGKFRNRPRGVSATENAPTKMSASDFQKAIKTDPSLKGKIRARTN